MKKIVSLILCVLFLSCCNYKNSTNKASTDDTSVSIKSDVNVPVFDADSAYSYVDRQVAFGPRVPNTSSHKACADYLVTELERHGAKLFLQEAALTAYNGDKLNAKNIIGSFNPDAKKRILLFAHWDSRPYADHDKDEANHKKSIDGADDGGSGAGVLLEIARQIGLNNISTGIDIIFFDAEDYGTPEFVKEYKENTWCLGSQHWAKNPHIPNYKANFGILLDMVGSKGANFYKESTSVKYAGQYVELVWSAARNLGYGRYFVNAGGGGIIDDHQYVIAERGIPCLDIINSNPNTGFGEHWHTVNDNMDIIDRQTLKAVGQTLLDVIYRY
jgi:Zn-dependent M28 family amino/carboxypeptidase